MEKAKPFDEYFDDEKLEPAARERMRLTRSIVHDLYPDVQERVSYAMPGFYPKNAVKATQQLFLLMANKEWLGLYGAPGLDSSALKLIEEFGLEVGKGSIRVPYDLPENSFRRLLRMIVLYNMERHAPAEIPNVRGE